MRLRVLTLACVTLMATSAAFGTSFVVPTDAELVAKSSAIVVGTVEGSYVQERNDTIETVYEIRAERALKSAVARGELVRVVSYGGVIGDRGLLVPASAHFRQGERVLLFLTRDGGEWRTTDMTLGKFRFAQSTAGERLLVRDMEDVVGWDRAGREHSENVRREAGFLRFIEQRVSGRPAIESQEYQVQSSAVTLQTAESSSFTPTSNAVFPAATYTDHVSNMPIRWPNMANGVTFWKRTDQNIAGAADGGASVIQNGLAAWTNDCGSNINLTYGGQRQTASANHDGVNIVEFNDPQSRVSGSWTGSGTIGITFLSFAGDHPFDNRTWLNITDADVVIQNGYTATHGAFGAAMTHELGHGLGWRHSNQNHLDGGACNSAVEECSSTAIMNTVVNGNYGYTLQTWDINAARTVYPGGSCGGTTPPPPPPPSCTPPTITSQPASSTITAGGSATLSVTAAGTSPFSYQWYSGTSGNTASPMSGATFSQISVTPSSTSSYWVRVTNSCGSVNSATATITVNPAPPPPPRGTRERTDFDGDGKADIFWRHSTLGSTTIWLMDGTNIRSALDPGAVSLAWTPVAFGDFNADGRSDIFWRNSNGSNIVWYMNGGPSRVVTYPPMDPAWIVDGSGDYNGDGTFDIFWRNTSTGANQIWRMANDTYSVLVLPAVATSWHVVASGNYDGDGDYDIFWSNSTTGGNAMWLMNPTGPSEVGMPAVGAGWRVEASADFSGDGRDDLFWRNTTSGANIVWRMNGLNYSAVTLPAVSTDWSIRMVGDLDANGTDDIGWRRTNGGVAAWIMSNGSVARESLLPGADPSWTMYGKD